MIENFTRVINPIKRKFGNRYGNVFIKIKFQDGKLSISGVEAPLRSGNARGSAGQIDMDYRGNNVPEIVFTKGWNREKWQKLLYIWKKYHLNDMQPGTPKQMESLEKYFGEERHSYDESVAYLKRVGLYEDNGYKYGSAWLKKEIPEEVIRWLQNLENTTTPYAWV